MTYCHEVGDPYLSGKGTNNYKWINMNPYYAGFSRDNDWILVKIYQFKLSKLTFIGVL